jgi:hypothetical protein
MSNPTTTTAHILITGAEVTLLLTGWKDKAEPKEVGPMIADVVRRAKVTHPGEYTNQLRSILTELFPLGFAPSLEWYPGHCYGVDFTDNGGVEFTYSLSSSVPGWEDADLHDFKSCEKFEAFCATFGISAAVTQLNKQRNKQPAKAAPVEAQWLSVPAPATTPMAITEALGSKPALLAKVEAAQKAPKASKPAKPPKAAQKAPEAAPVAKPAHPSPAEAAKAAKAKRAAQAKEAAKAAQKAPEATPVAKAAKPATKAPKAAPVASPGSYYRPSKYKPIKAVPAAQSSL